MLPFHLDPKYRRVRRYLNFIYSSMAPSFRKPIEEELALVYAFLITDRFFYEQKIPRDIFESKLESLNHVFHDILADFNKTAEVCRLFRRFKCDKPQYTHHHLKQLLDFFEKVKVHRELTDDEKRRNYRQFRLLTRPWCEWFQRESYRHGYINYLKYNDQIWSNVIV